MARRRSLADNVNAALRQRFAAGGRRPIVAGALQEVVKDHAVKRGAALKQSIRESASLGANSPAVARPAYARPLVQEAFTAEAFDPLLPVTALKGPD